jgi:hypothetical protein
VIRGRDGLYVRTDAHIILERFMSSARYSDEVTARVSALAALVTGAVLAFVSLETAGFAMLLLVPVGVALKRRRAARIPLLVVSFAVGYLLGIGFFAVETSGIVNGGSVDWGVAAYFASLAGVGVALLIVGTVMAVRAREGDRPAGSGGTHSIVSPP